MHEIDTSAPFQVVQSITIHAPIETVWQLITDIDSWPKWQPGVGKAVLKGAVQPGTEFHWTGQGLPIVSTFLEVTVPHRVSWKGKAIGIQAIHIWVLEEKDGTTVVTTEESWSGWLASLFKLFSSAMLDTAVAESLHTLKQQAEIQHQQR